MGTTYTRGNMEMPSRMGRWDEEMYKMGWHKMACWRDWSNVIDYFEDCSYGHAGRHSDSQSWSLPSSRQQSSDISLVYSLFHFVTYYFIILALPSHLQYILSLSVWSYYLFYWANQKQIEENPHWSHHHISFFLAFVALHSFCLLSCWLWMHCPCC